jgi:hypothetical protein
MASVLKVDKLDPQSGTALELGTSGDTISVPSGATLDISSATLTPPATMPASSAANLTNIPGANITGTIAAVSGANLTSLNATQLASGTVPTARLGSGTASSSTFLAGDQTYKAAGGGILVAVTEFTSTVAGTFSANTLNGLDNMTQGYPILDGVAHTPTNAAGRMMIVSSIVGSNETSNVADYFQWGFWVDGSFEIGGGWYGEGLEGANHGLINNASGLFSYTGWTGSKDMRFAIGTNGSMSSTLQIQKAFYDSYFKHHIILMELEA